MDSEQTAGPEDGGGGLLARVFGLRRSQPAESEAKSRQTASPAAIQQVELCETPAASGVLAQAYVASTRALLSHAEQARSSGWAMAPGAVPVDALVADVVQGLGALVSATGYRVVREPEAARDLVCSADPVWIRRAVTHLLLRAISLDVAPPYVRLKVTRRPGEVHLVVLSSSPDVQQDVKGDLRAIRSLVAAMGGDVLLEPRRAGYYPVSLVLTAMAQASALRRVA